MRLWIVCWNVVDCWLECCGLCVGRMWIVGWSVVDCGLVGVLWIVGVDCGLVGVLWIGQSVVDRLECCGL